VTFNTSGTYNPRYGKQKVYVTGKAQDGSYVPGNANYNIVPGNANYNTIPGTAYYSYSPGYSNPSVPGYTNPPIPGNSYVSGGYTFGYMTQQLYTVSSGTYTVNTNPVGYFAYAYVPSDYYATDRYGTVYLHFTIFSYNVDYSTNPSTPGNTNSPSPGNYVSPSYPYAGTNPTNYSYSGTNPTNYPYASTNPDVATTGSGYSLLGVYFPGGYGTTAPSIGSTKVSVSYGSSIPVSVSGGYVTINFSL
jgi:hypothetical protein